MPDPFIHPAEAAEMIKRLNEGGGGRTRRGGGPSAPIPPPPEGWVEPPLPPEIQEEIDRARASFGDPGVGGESRAAKEPSAAGEDDLPPVRPARRVIAPQDVAVRPAHSQVPVLRMVDLEGATVLTNDGTYALSPTEVKAIHVVCERAIARNLREYLKALRKR